MVIEATRAMVAQRMSQLDPSHDMLHVERVRRLGNIFRCIVRLKPHPDHTRTFHLQALEVADPAADREVIELAALCHDLNDAKYSGMVDGAIDIEAFLSHHGYAKANLVATIVHHIGYRKEIQWNDATDDLPNVTWRNTCLELHAQVNPFYVILLFCSDSTLKLTRKSALPCSCTLLGAFFSTLHLVYRMQTNSTRWARLVSCVAWLLVVHVNDRCMTRTRPTRRWAITMVRRQL